MCRKAVPARERYTRQRSSSISKKGVPYCSVEYTNFGGKLSDAPMEYTEDGEYTTHPVGEFYGRELPFTILLGEEHVRIQWAIPTITP